MLQKSKTKYLYVIFIISASIFSLIIRIFLPATPIYGSMHDDELYIRMADQIRNGNWLGNWDSNSLLTLAKSPGYGIFLAFAMKLGLNPLILVHFIILVSFAIFFFSLHRLGLNFKFLSFMYIFSIYCPIWYSDHFSRIYREGLLTAIIALFFALIVNVIIQIYLDNHKGQSSIIYAIKFALIGISFGYFVITKNNWHILLFALILFFVFTTLMLKNFMKLIFLWIILISCFLFPVTSVMHHNYKSYGVYLLDDFAYGEFPKVNALLYSIKVGDNPDFVLSPKSQRLVLYANSPTAAKLEPFLENLGSNGWLKLSCTSSLQICDDFSHWFPWALRSAFAESGLAEDERSFQLNLKNIRTDIERYCLLENNCRARSLGPGIKSIDLISERRFIDSLSFGIYQVLSLQGMSELVSNQIPTQSQTVLWDKVPGFWDDTYLNRSSPYEKNDFVLGDLKILWTKIYFVFWFFFCVTSLITYGSLLKAAKYSRKSMLALILTTFFIFSIILHLSLLAILSASSGFYMNNTYLHPVYFYILFIIGILSSISYYVIEKVWLSLNSKVVRTNYFD